MGEVALRPIEDADLDALFARAASDNLGSLRGLQRAGFTITGSDVGYANGRNAEIEETILRLDDAGARP